MPGKWWITPVALVAVALSAAACSGGVDQDDLDALQARVEAADQHATQALVLALLPALNPSTLHAIDEAANNDGAIDTSAPGFVTHVLEVLELPVWPDVLRPHVDQFHAQALLLNEAVQNDDAAAAAEPARLTHALAHPFTEAVNAWIAGEAVPPPPDLASADDSSDESTESSDASGH